MGSEEAGDARDDAPAAIQQVEEAAPPPPSQDAADAAAAAVAPPPAATAPAEQLSKKAQKRMARAARVAEFRAARKEQRREERREAREAAQSAKRQRWAEEDAAGDGSAANANANDDDQKKQQQRAAREEAARLGHERRMEQARARAARRAAATAPGAQRVAVDLRWADARMTPQERRSLAQQLSFSYAAALAATEPGPPLHLHLLGAAGLLRAQMESQLAGLGRWAATVVHDDALLLLPPAAAGEGEGGEEEGAKAAVAAGEAAPAAPPKPFDDDGGDAGAVPIAEFFAARGVPARDLVYLSADSPNELDGDKEDEDGDEKEEGGGDGTGGDGGNGDGDGDGDGSGSNKQPPARPRRGLDPSKVYVVGGIVDRNRHKGACLRRAEAAGMSHARLPIERHLAAAAATGAAAADGGGARRLAGSRVLTVNQVFELLARRAAGDTWARALAVVIPARKTAEVPVAAAAAKGGPAAEADAYDGEQKDDAVPAT